MSQSIHPGLLQRASMIATAALALLLSGARADADQLWSLAGTFNNWNAADPQWTMVPTGDPASGQQVLERRIEAGQYRFKFVRDGAWDRGHLGAAGSSGSLEQPGEDIALNIRADAEYRIFLDPKQRIWRITVAKIDQPVVVMRVLGQPYVNRPIRLWAGDSLYQSEDSDLQVMFSAVGVPTERAPFGGDRFGMDITPSETGPLTLEVTLVDGDQTAKATTQVQVTQPATLGWATKNEPKRPGWADLELQSDGVLRTMMRVARDTTFNGITVSTGVAGGAVSATSAFVPAGVYAVEVRDGKVVTAQNPGLPLILLPGNWRRFVYRPERPVASVHLVGDFNGWSGPGTPRAIEMLSRADGAYSAIVDLPEGAQRYAFVENGDQRIPDPKNGREARDPSGAMASLLIVGPTPAEYPKPLPGEIHGPAVRHNPASAADFTPISAGLGLADVSICALPGDVETATMVLETKDKALRIPMRRELDAAGFDRFTARVMAGAPDMKYSFTLVDGSASHTTGMYTTRIEPGFETPDWAKGAVWYQIFPERFRNGNPKNDPSGPGVTLMKWTGDWYAIDPEEERQWRLRAGLKPGDPLPERKGGALFNMIFDRRYGGDLQGVVEKLDYIKSLGVSAIYLNPIFEAESLHKYDATDYRHIDDNLGTPASAGKTSDSWKFIASETADPATWTWTESDRYFVDVFLPECRKRGLRVVLDGVFNHTGKAFWAFADIEQRGEASPYKDWFFVTFGPDGKLQSWQSWFNTGSLPKFQQVANGDLVPPVKSHIFNITRRWMDPNGDGDPADGIDGWRLDVALDVGMPFWRDWRKLVKQINPEAVIIAEIWDDADPYMAGDAFDTQMHYPFAIAVTEWLGVRPGMSEFDLRRALDAAFDNTPQTNLIHQNLFGSHDTDRLASMLLNPGRQYDQGNRPQDHDFPYVDKRPSKEIYERSLLGVAIQATYLGAPMIYYGDEVGMWGADDPTDRKPFPWPDTPPQRADERADASLQAEYTRWLGLRHDSTIGPIVRFGNLRHIESGNPGVFAFERSLNGKRLVVVVNRQSEAFDASRLLPASTANTKLPPESARHWLLN